jgi:coniferyl-aldehyde dehydrogenase
VSTRQLVNTGLRLAVKRLWDKDVSVEQLRVKAATGDAWLMRHGSRTPALPVTAHGVACEWVGEEAAARRGVMLFLHGGAFCLHLPNGYRLLAHRLAEATGMRVLVPDYRLAPEHPFPAGLDDCFAAYRWLLDQGFPAERLAIAGDSAGGNLCLSVLMRARDHGLPLPACAALISPITDFTGSGPSVQANEASDVLFSRPALQLVQTAYLGGAAADDPAASPLFGDWVGLPPLLFHASGSEMLLDDSLRAVDRARASGVQAEAKVWPDLPHVFQLIDLLPEARESLAEIGRFIGERMASPVALEARVATPTTAQPTQEMQTMDPVIQRMQDVFERQRQAFLSHPFPTLAERKAKLKTLRELLQRYQDQIVTAVSADFGGRAPAETKLAEVLGPVLEINHALHALSGWMKPRRRSTELLFLGNSVRVNYQPKGVVGVIGAWNFPLYLSVGPLVAALAAGNRVMMKLSELSPRSTELLAKMLAEGFAEDEVAVFGGEVAQAQAFSHLPFNHIVFTGSPAVGHHIMRAASQNLTPVTLELGGKSPALVSSAGPLADAAERIAHGKAFNSGQICVSPDYALVPRGQVDEFASAVQASFRRFYPTVQGNHEYTSMACEPHAQRIRDLLAEAAAKGAKVTPCGDSGPGRRIPLHVVTGVTEDMRIAKEELFGPILPVIPYDNIDQAIAYITARPRPLAMYPFGFSAADLDKLMTRTHSGGVSVDDWGWHVFNHDLPFGGVGNSGMGTYHGEEGFRELSHAKGTFKRFRWFPMGLFYPPYGNLVQRMVFKFYLGHGDPALGAPAPVNPSAQAPLH